MSKDEYKLKYGSYREYKEHQKGDMVNYSLKAAIFVGACSAIGLTAGDEPVFTIAGASLAFAAFAFCITLMLGIGNENAIYVKREYEANTLDEELYRTDSSYHSHVNYFVAQDSIEEQNKRVNDEFIVENKNRFGK